jgi:hypothetical protein
MKPLDRITVIRQSLRVFVCGLASLLPLVGVVSGTCALVSGWRLRRGYQDFNPADNYRRWGMVLGSVGILLSGLFALWVGLSIASDGC